MFTFRRDFDLSHKTQKRNINNTYNYQVEVWEHLEAALVVFSFFETFRRQIVVIRQYLWPLLHLLQDYNPQRIDRMWGIPTNK